MRAQLTFIGGMRDGEDIEIAQGHTLRFGRSTESDVIIAEDGISRNHFQITARGALYLITDLNSSYGTYVNGVKIASRILQLGDEITVGRVTLHFDSAQDTTIHLKPELELRGSEEKGSPSSSSSRILVARSFEGDSDIGQAIAHGADDLETINRLRQALQTIYRVSNLVLSEDNLDILFNAVMDVVMDTLKPERAYLVMWDEEAMTIEPVVVRRKSEDSRETTRRLNADLELGPSKGVVLESITRSLAIITENAQLDPRFQDSQSVKFQGIRSAMCAPVRSATQKIGAIYIDRLFTGERFAEHELELLAAIGRQAGLAIERARVYEDMESLFYSCVRALVTAIEAKDAYTHGHSERVAAFAITIAEEMGVDAETMDNVRLGALLHDVGKIGVSEKILTKPARLSAAEIEVIRAHPARGAEILGHIRNIPDVIAAVRWHHEMWNGLGYPDGLVGEQIPLTARIVAIADAFDAMTSNRSYRRNFDVDESIAEFQRCSGDQFEPEICEIMQQLLKSGRIIPCNDLFARGIDVSTRVY